MTADLADARATSWQDEASLRDMLEVFRRGSALVNASLAIVAALGPKLDMLNLLIDRDAESRSQVGHAVSELAQMLHMATAEGENLLLTPRSSALSRPLVVFALARQASGALAVQSIEIDRAAIAVSDGIGRQADLPFDRLFQAVNATPTPPDSDRPTRVRNAFDAFRTHTNLIVSRLSIAKARFDLQASFLNAIATANASSASLRFETGLNRAGARDMAVETRRMLGGQSLNIANSRHDAGGLPPVLPGKSD